MNKVKAILLIVAALLLAYVAYQKFSLPLDAAHFSPEILYRGSEEEMTIDPKDYYSKLHGMSFDSHQHDENCIPNVIPEKNSTPILEVTGNYLPVLHKDNEKDYASLIGSDGIGLFKDKDTIIMPVSNSKFKNSNLQNSTLGDKSNSRRDIEIIKGDKILIVVEDIMTWWCHFHNPTENVKHNVKIGYNSDIESINGGNILGVAKETTKIKVYQIKQDFYTDTYNIEDVKSLDELEQIDAGIWFTTGEIIKL